MIVDIAILGGGIVGTSLANSLGELGQENTLVIERDRIGSGSTGKSVGGIRSLFTDRLETELSIYSHRAFRQLADDISMDFRFRQCGYLMVATSDERHLKLQRIATQARSMGVEVYEMDSSSIARIVPGIRLNAVKSAIFSPEDGYMPEPAQLAVAYARRAREFGVNILEHTAVQHIEAKTSSFIITCDDRIVEAEQIVFALNAFVLPILKTFDVNLPSFPYPRHVFEMNHPSDSLPENMPMTIFSDDDLMICRQESRLLSICGFREESTDNVTFASHRLGEVKRRIEKRISGGVSNLTLAWSGLRAVTPDRRAIVGSLPSVPRAWCAIGFSGHGLMHAPAVGFALAEQILGTRRPTFDLAPLDPQRWSNWQGPPPVLESTHA